MSFLGQKNQNFRWVRVAFNKNFMGVYFKPLLTPLKLVYGPFPDSNADKKIPYFSR
jgi:hypothetical protein